MSVSWAASLPALCQQGRALQLPFDLSLPGGTARCETLLRILPGKRLVLRAQYRGEAVLLKIFFQAKHCREELAGYQLLHGTGVCTPALLDSHVADDAADSGGVCVYQYLAQGQPLDGLWQTAELPHKQQLLLQLLQQVRQCHAAQVMQQDIHLGNFLLADGVLYMLDPASCTRVSRRSAIDENLALLLAQLPAEDWQMMLMQCDKPGRLCRLALKHCRNRQRNYLRKIQRDCTEVADLSAAGMHILCRRDALTPALAAYLQAPTTWPADAVLLKPGNSAQVFRIRCGEQDLVVKQYRNKDWQRSLRRLLRSSRAARAWQFAHLLQQAGIDVPAPVALIEKKRGPLVTASWYLCQYRQGDDLLGAWAERAPSVSEKQVIQRLFRQLQQAGISHGDMKGSNLLSDGERIALIDYDGARLHGSSRAAQHALTEDKKRFLRNWADQPALQKMLAELVAP